MLSLWPSLKSLLIWICSSFFLLFVFFFPTIFLFFHPYCITIPLAKRTDRGESGANAVAQWIHSGYNKHDEFSIPSPFSLPSMVQCGSLDLLNSRSSSCDVQMSDNIVCTPPQQPTVKQSQQLLLFMWAFLGHITISLLNEWKVLLSSGKLKVFLFGEKDLTAWEGFVFQ